MRKALSLALAFGIACSTAWAAGPAELIDAVQARNTAAAIKLLDQKVNVNGTSSDGTTALHWAVHNADADMVDRLIRAGANISAKNEFGTTPISRHRNVGTYLPLNEIHWLIGSKLSVI